MKLDRQHLFIGYVTLEAWVRAIDRSRPVYGGVFLEAAGPAERGGGVPHQVILLLSQIDEAERVHYCRLLLGNPTPYTDLQRAYLDRGYGLLAVIKDWLQAERLTVRDAVIAMPANLYPVAGTTESIVWDEERAEFIRKGEHVDAHA